MAGTITCLEVFEIFEFVEQEHAYVCLIVYYAMQN